MKQVHRGQAAPPVLRIVGNDTVDTVSCEAAGSTFCKTETDFRSSVSCSERSITRKLSVLKVLLHNKNSCVDLALDNCVGNQCLLCSRQTYVHYHRHIDDRLCSRLRILTQELFYHCLVRA